MNNIELRIPPRTISIDGHPLFRYLPFTKKRAVGPFVFLDYLPPSETAGEGLSVRPHPHIGLSTLSYLYRGQALHRDTLGNELVLKPGDVNWMTAGRGIAHSERTPEGLSPSERQQHMLQFWVALPKDQEEREPEFFHHPKSEIPQLELNGVSITLIAGSAFGKKSPVKAYSKLVFMSLESARGGELEYETEDQTIGLIVLSGQVEITGQAPVKEELVVFEKGSRLKLKVAPGARFVLFGGLDFPEERFIEWNFVSSSKARIQQAKSDWREQKFGQVPNETDFIPLPE